MSMCVSNEESNATVVLLLLSIGGPGLLTDMMDDGWDAACTLHSNLF